MTRRPFFRAACRGAVLLAVLLCTIGGCSLRQRYTAWRGVRVASVEALPPFQTAAWEYGRDAGNSVRMGSQLLWIFGDTFTWSGLRCATAAWSPVDNPTALHERFDEWFAPLQFYEYSIDEEAFNVAHEQVPTCCSEREQCPTDATYCHCPTGTDCWSRIAIWPGDTVNINDVIGLNYYEKVQVGTAPLDYRHLGTGIAIVRRGSTRALRPSRDSEPLLIFSADEPNFLRATAAHHDGRSYIYLFASTNRVGCNVDVLVARVRINRALRREAYRFWDGENWVPDLSAARPVLAGIGGGLGSVAWNEYLGSYLSAVNDICVGGNTLLMRMAPRPEGPWSDATAVDLSHLGARPDAYAGQLHPSLGNGREMVISYYQPLRDIEGSVHLARITFE
jgi:hypothetical protein